MKHPKNDFRSTFRVSSVSKKIHAYYCVVGSGCLCSLSPCKGSTVEKVLPKLQQGYVWAAAKSLIVLQLLCEIIVYIRMLIISFTKYMATHMTS